MKLYIYDNTWLLPLFFMYSQMWSIRDDKGSKRNWRLIPRGNTWYPGIADVSCTYLYFLDLHTCVRYNSEQWLRTFQSLFQEPTLQDFWRELTLFVFSCYSWEYQHLIHKSQRAFRRMRKNWKMRITEKGAHQGADIVGMETRHSHT